ncbi:peroxiredoxin [Longispora fulva]|uniref:Osmotically inducible protein OsmC n=1 Tax=Longispora fulva TaxID=619741 RepID=A0A8J7KNB5_9ACTN|nr:OsmC family peroxiredoxin [Longispora fulva]MBG6141439.1 osmotically inducible protein OsmC [Longispora fulva]GIG59411.1 peroxiredoxin [Longispora fulva]
MATTRTARTHWEGSLLKGGGSVELASSGLGTFDVTWAARTEPPSSGRTSPEELLAAAHSSCFSMAFSNILDKAGHAPDSLEVSAEVGFQPGVGVTGSAIRVRGVVPGMSEDEFVALAHDAKENCPVSKALSIEITLDAALA